MELESQPNLRMPLRSVNRNHTLAVTLITTL